MRAARRHAASIPSLEAGHGVGGPADFLHELASNPHLFDESYTRWGPIRWMAPETLLTLGDHLGQRGWTPADIRAVLAGNFSRVA